MKKNKTNYLTSSEAAALLSVDVSYIRYLILRGKIKAEKIGRDWAIKKKDLKCFKRKRFPRHTNSLRI